MSSGAALREYAVTSWGISARDEIGPQGTVLI